MNGKRICVSSFVILLLIQCVAVNASDEVNFSGSFDFYPASVVDSMDLIYFHALFFSCFMSRSTKPLKVDGSSVRRMTTKVGFVACKLHGSGFCS